MVTNEERREVARRLRHAWVNVPDRDPVRHHLRVLNEIYEAIGISDGEADAIDLFNRLADLIEPCDMSHGCRDTVACDRDALLALADDVDGAADDSGGFEPLAGMLRDIARSIREAVGVES